MQRIVWRTALLAFAVTLACVWIFVVLRDRAETLEQARHRLDATAWVLDQHADRALETGDRVLRGLVEVARPLDLTDPAQASNAYAQTRRIIADGLQISSAWLMDALGVARVESWSDPPASEGSYAHRPYFQALRDNLDAGLHIGEAQAGTVSGRPRFTMSRPLLDAQGRFAGAAVAGIFTDYFDEIYAEADLGRGARLHLTRLDGAVLVAWPAEQALPAPEKVIQASRTLDRFPIRITLVQPLADILADWQARTVGTGAAALAILAAFGALTRLGLRGAEREAAALARLEASNHALERRVAERTTALAASEAELQALYQTAPVGLCVLSPDLRFLRVNRRMAEMNGLPAEAHIGRRVAEIVPDLDQAANALAVRVLHGGEAVHGLEIEGETPAHPGVRRHWSESWLPLKDAAGTIIGLNIVAEEVTERRAAEVALRAANQRLTQLLDGMGEGFVVCDRDFRVVMVNRQAETLDGRPRSDLIGRTPWELWPATLDTPLESALRRVMQDRVAETLEQSWRGRRRLIWLDLRLFPTEEGVGVLFRDVTARIRAETEIRQLLDRTQQLSAYNEVAAREMGHRIMNSLQTLEGLLLLQARATDEPAARAVMNLATQRVRAMAVVQRRLFHATRADAMSLDLGDYLRDLATDLTRSFIGADRCSLEIEAAPGIRVGATDGSAAAMVVAELCVNACKYAFEDGDRGRVTVRLERLGEGYRLEVRDNGRGLPPGFEPKSSRGLGMRIMQGMTHQLGGTLEIDRTRPGTGFTLDVPVSRPPPVADPPQAAGSAPLSNT
ncbi:PAS domain-containing protein [Falsiroseomonas sp. HC035]|uniref:PAS domain-containing protein n=1 Tax=Falsiroseomonas sp. HC035 TaxID=3390999 RepID=UPI003D31819D